MCGRNVFKLDEMRGVVDDVTTLLSCWNFCNSAVKSIGLRVLAYDVFVIGSTPKFEVVF